MHREYIGCGLRILKAIWNRQDSALEEGNVSQLLCHNPLKLLFHGCIKTFLYARHTLHNLWGATGKMADLARGNALLHCEEMLSTIIFFRKAGSYHSIPLRLNSVTWDTLRMTNAPPTIFASGDIVEVLVSLVMIPTGNQYTLRPILRALTLLDSSEKEVRVLKASLKYF